MGRWLVQAEKDTPSGTKILAQLDTDATSYRFPVAVADSVSLSIFVFPYAVKPFPEK